MKKLTDREKWALRALMRFDVVRYLLANTHGRRDGGERAERHINISKWICRFIFCRGDENYDPDKVLDSWKVVHDFMAIILTDKMDEAIGFPIDERPDDYDDLTNKFINVLFDHINEFETIAKAVLVDDWDTINTIKRKY